MIKRNIAGILLEALADSPVVLLNGARQTGKSTLVQWLSEGQHPARYLTMDDATVLAAAAEDPTGFIQGLKGPVILDEIQRVPALFPPIKVEVDRHRTAGRFLLTGSANVLLLPDLSESLSGRMEILTLWPFSAGELGSVTETFIDMAFSGRPLLLPASSLSRSELFRRIVAGGFPEAVQRTTPRRRRAWFGSYITTILQRDVRDLANIEHLTALPRLLALLAARATTLLNLSELSRSAGLAQSTLKRYMALLETTFLVQLLPPWSANLGKRLVKSPKILLSDAGLMAHLLGLGNGPAGLGSHVAGPLLENFVAMELRKQAAWSETQPQMFHFRTQTGQEVDIVLEDARGRVVGVEVKAASSVSASDFRHLKALREALGDRFIRGVVLHTGSEGVPFSGDLLALPVSALWQARAPGP